MSHRSSINPFRMRNAIPHSFCFCWISAFRAVDPEGLTSFSYAFHISLELINKWLLTIKRSLKNEELLNIIFNFLYYLEKVFHKIMKIVDMTYCYFLVARKLELKKHKEYNGSSASLDLILVAIKALDDWQSSFWFDRCHLYCQ